MDWYDGYGERVSCDVICPDGPVDTGVLTPDGAPIMRTMDPIGFGIYPVAAPKKRKGKGGKC
jgi:hypothetical protein